MKLFNPTRTLFWIVCFATLNPTCLQAGDIRKKYNFNPDWKVSIGETDGAGETDYDDSQWKKITLPYAWNEDEAFMKDIRELSTGIAWYRKHFKLSQEDKDRKVFIEFEGVRQAAEIYVNGQYAGLHENGITSFGFDITGLVNFGKKENVIAVRTDNSWDYREQSTNTRYQWADRNFNANYGGLTKNTYLHITNKIYQTLPLYSPLKTTGQYIYARAINIPERRAVITAETEVRNESGKPAEFTYEVILEDLDGNTVAMFDGGKIHLAQGETKIISASGDVGNLNFWSWGYGYLYTVQTILKQNGKIFDRVSTRTGFRKTEFSNGMIKLNDRVIMMKGYAQRTSNEWPAVGLSVPPWMSDYSNGLIVKSNGNLVRWMHITPWKQDVESCDRVGLMQAMPAGDSERDRQGRHWEQRVEVMRDAIIYNRNNPSIIFYESGNKGISEEHMQEMKDLRDTYDPFGGRAAGSREMMESEVAEYGGEMLYVNLSDEKPVWATEYMRDEGLRKYWDEYSPPYHKDGEGPQYNGQDASAYNRNQDSHACEAVKRWYDYYRQRPGSGKRVSSGGVNIIFSESNTHHRGTENYRRSGEVDALRIPKDAFFAHQTIWNGWVDIEEHNTHIIGHWNYTQGVVKNIYVVSTGDRVELFVNGNSAGYGKKESGFLFTFDSIAWQPGKIEAVSYDRQGEKLKSDIRITAGEPEGIRMTLINSPAGIKADGTDMVLVEVEVVDKRGQRCPTALNIIDFKLEGPAEWRGGMAQGPDNYILSSTLPVECGVNRVLIRTLPTPGEINLVAKSTDLEGASLSFISQGVKVENGLSLQMPSDGLPVSLERGPTPLTVSYTPHRTSVKIISARAGTNQENAALSFDGKQSTRWVNDGSLETGWIEYQLDGENPVTQIALKLSGWRTRSYPIVVSANDSILYRGVTSPNLGYFYIELPKPVITDHLKVRLFGKTEFNDVYKLVEITGKLDKETADDMAVSEVSNLNIVDIEVYTE